MKKTVLLVSLAVILLSVAAIAFAAPGIDGKILSAAETGIDPTATGTLYIVTLTDPTSHLNIRDDASMDGAIIGKLNDKAEIEVLGFVGDWAAIRLDGNNIAYVSKVFIAENTEGKPIPGTVAVPQENSPIMAS